MLNILSYKYISISFTPQMLRGTTALKFIATILFLSMCEREVPQMRLHEAYYFSTKQICSVFNDS